MDLIEAFRYRCEAYALMWQTDQVTLHDAVDRLQTIALRDGAVELVGQDYVQWIMHCAFAPVRDDLSKLEENSNFQQLCDAADKRQFVEPQDDPQQIGDDAPQATWNAVQYALRTDGLEALPQQRARLATFSKRQIEDLIWSLRKHERKGWGKIDPRLLELLTELL